jgi:PAS domain-containing protein
MIDSPMQTAKVLQHEWESDLARCRSNSDFRRLLAILPAAAYTCDAEGLITDYNQRAVEVWGREPKRNDPLDRY